MESGFVPSGKLNFQKGVTKVVLLTTAFVDTDIVDFLDLRCSNSLFQQQYEEKF